MTNKYREWKSDDTNQDPLKRDYALYTDGSGHKDGIGGACSIAIRNSDNTLQVAREAATHTTVARMEFIALLRGLELICRMEGLKSPYSYAKATEDRKTVFWLSDRKDLVLSVAGIYCKKSNLDLWAQYAFYETILDIHPFHTTRNAHPLNKKCDKYAGDCRRIMKELTTIDKKG
jgi:ribonuclease HI